MVIKRGKKMREFWGRGISFFMVCVMVLTVMLQELTIYAGTEQEEPYVVSLNRTVYASSTRGSASASLAVDGDENTRWESDWQNTQEWIYLDLGKITDITSIDLKWEGAYAKKYSIQFSDDEITWENQRSITNGAAGWVTHDVSGEARFVRILCEEKGAPAYGYSLFEFRVYGRNGLTKPPVNYGENLAMGKKVTASSVQKEWWMDPNGTGIYDQTNVLAENAVDGKNNTSWHSDAKSDQWIYIDLGAETEIGRIIVNWNEDAASTYDIDISNDASTWTTIYRELKGRPEVKNIPLKVNAKYIRIYGYGSYSNNGFSIKELEVYPYVEGDEAPAYQIPALPQTQTVQVPGSDASYATNDIRFPQAKAPTYLDDSLQAPVDSNDWWQSMLIKELGNALSLLPLKAKYETNGLGIITLTDGWFDDTNYVQGDVTSTKGESKIDLYIAPESMNTSELYNKVSRYDDYSVTADLYDADGLAMQNTMVKGSPYVYTDFGNRQDILIYSNNITDVFDGNGNSILTQQNVALVTDHIGIEITDDDNLTGTMASKSYYCINVPVGTEFKKVGSKIKVKMPAADGYMSLAAMTGKEQIETFYKHGYAFVTGTKVTYQFDETTNEITSFFQISTDLKRNDGDFSNQTLQCLLPHQWKKSTSTLSGISYTSPRGVLKVHEGNEFTTTDTFYGIVPQFATPENEEYDETELLAYLARLDQSTKNKESLLGGDAYWQGKSLHPLALGVLVADQIGNTDYRDKFVERLRYIFDDWMVYSGEGDESYFFYDQNWGTLYYKYSEFGANTGITDHHFTYGYMVFAAAVLATYDDDFYEKYKEMIDLIVRDYASPYEDDEMFCRFRSFDLYEGHSWAGGYADNDDGNNQEAAGESLFGWVGQYLWGIRSGNNDFRDAAIFGFTTELTAIKQYWFNYDNDNWLEDYPSKVVGQVYGSNYFFGTFFDGNPTSIYGIHWLPIAEYITYYGMEQEAISSMYEGLLVDIEGQSEKRNKEVGDKQPGDEGYYTVKTTSDSWQHIFVPLLAQFDPDKAFDEMDFSTQSDSEGFNTYWFVNNMKELGVRTTDIWAIGGVSATVYKNGSGDDVKYTAIAWNPTGQPMEVNFTDGTSIVGSATIGAKSLLKLDPRSEGAVQAATPEFSIPAGTYSDTQYVKITSATEGAAIYYTTDGSTPTEKSNLYSGRIPISSTTTLKAIAVKDGYIKSSMKAVTFVINGSGITMGVNIAQGKEVTTSSYENPDLDGAKIVDSNASTRWSSGHTDDEWCYIDLGDNFYVNKVKISWESSYASKYEIQVSKDAQNWTTAAEIQNGKGGLEEIIFDAVEARYVKMQGIKRASAYGYSIWEMGVYEARQIAKPQFSLPSGTYDGNQYIAIASATKGVEIRYTTDGSTPTKDSQLYIPRITVWQNTAIKAAAFKEGMIASEPAEVTYTINNGFRPNEGEDNYDPHDDFIVEKELEAEEEELASNTGSGQNNDSDLITGNLAYKKTVTVSSSENENTKQAVTDANLGTTWSSNFENVTDRHTEWCYIDLGEGAEFAKVVIYWATNTPGNQYKIQVSNDAEDWTDVSFSKVTEEGNKDVCTFDNAVEARYVKMQGVQIGMAWGYAIRQMLVYAPEGEPIPVESVSLDQNEISVGVGETVTLTATVLPDEATEKTVVWSSAKTAVAKVHNGIVTGIGSGRTTIEAEAGGVTDTCTVTVKSRLAAVVPAVQKTGDNEITVSWDTVASAVSYDLYRRNRNGEAYVKIAENISGSSYIDKELAGGVYNYKVVAKPAASEEFLLESIQSNASASITILVAVTGVSLNHSQGKIEVGSFVDITATVLPETATNRNVTWSTEDNKIATVSNGRITGVGVGKTKITVETEDGGKTAEYSVEVIEKQDGSTIAVTGVRLSHSQGEIEVGSFVDITATVLPETATNKDVTWSTGDKKIATVSNGRITGVGVGTTTITVTTEDGDKTAEYSVKVIAKQGGNGNQAVKVSELKISEKLLQLKLKETKTLVITVLPGNAGKNVTWKSENEKIATVENGQVKAVGMGTTTITATAKDGSGKSISCSVKVGYGITYKNMTKAVNNNPKVYYNEKVTLKKPTKAGYIFSGWYTDSKYKKKITSIKKGTKGDYTLYAKWTQVKVDKISKLTLKNNKTKQIQVSYKPVSSKKGYEITYSTSSKFNSKDTKVIRSSNVSVTLKNLLKYKTYYVKVRAYKIDSMGSRVYGKAGKGSIKVSK